MEKIVENLRQDSWIAVIRLRSLGDSVLITPALALLKQARPDVRIAVALDESLVPLLEGAPDIDLVVPVARGKPLATVKQLRELKPELCMNLHGGSTSAWLTAFSGARWRAGYEHFRNAAAYNLKIPRAQEILGRAADAPVHTAEHHAAAVFHLGVSRREIPRARLGADAPPDAKPYAVLHVAAAYETKRWSEERFLAVGQTLHDRHGLESTLIAGPGQDHLLEFFPDSFTRRPGLGLRGLKSLMSGAALFVGNDSGPAHVAAAFGVPSVVVFGSSDSTIWGPWRTPSEVVETTWDCKPCPGDRCYAFDEPRCILSIETSAVEAAVERLLADPGV